MKTRIILLIAIFGSFHISCNNNSQLIDLREYKTFFASSDTINVSYWIFNSRYSSYDNYINDKYMSFNNIDSLDKQLWIDNSARHRVRFFSNTDSLNEHLWPDNGRVYVQSIYHQFTKLNENEFIDRSLNESGPLFHFSQDSIIIKSIWSLPVKIKIGVPYIGGDLTFIRKEILYFGTKQIECLVVSCTAKQGKQKWTFWLNPKTLFVKIQVYDDEDKYYTTMLLEKNELFSNY
jgi:hypothetical protein